MPAFVDTRRVEEALWRSADGARERIARGARPPAWFRDALLAIPAADRDAWLDATLGLAEIPDDGPELPRGCVPYLPCPVADLLRVVERTPIGAADVVVDVGSGVGRAAAAIHLLTGAPVVGLELQTRMVDASRALAARLGLAGISFELGDAAALAGSVDAATVFFLYCPFGGERLAELLARLEPVARVRPIRVACVDLPLPPCGWLEPDEAPPDGVQVHRSAPRPR
jgi:SAM-dependent methyltransferase